MRKKSFWLLEIIIWFILLVGLISIGINFTENYLSSRKTFNVTFKDIDGLIIGSPVRLMGIQVGHVTKVEPIDDNVNITFVVTNSNVIVPENSSVNVQFTGLAGSKSIEIQPSVPNISGNNSFKVTEPIRIASIIDVQSDITKSILDCSNIALSFLGHGGVEEFRKTIKQSTLITTDINNSMGNAYKIVKTSNNEIISDSQYIQKFLNKETQDLDYINNEVFKFPSTTKHKVVSILNDMQNISKPLENGKFNNYADRFVSRLKNVNQNISLLNQDIKKNRTNNPDLIDNIYNSFNGFIYGCQKSSILIENSFKRENIHKIRTQTEMLKNKTRSKETVPVLK
ncbi:MAG: MlaD family protein [Candidatus Gastranaerophilales bacterium]|nr:MlaD family protein [Candidatus Gastranaerophilales bacterium]